MLGGIKDQLEYLEICFGFETTSGYDEVIEFVNSLNGIKLKTSLYYERVGVQRIGELLASPGVWCVINLQIMDAYDHLNNPDNIIVLSNPKIRRLELYNCRMSLEGFLLSDRNLNNLNNLNNWNALRKKVRALEVSGIGRIDERITDANLGELKMERLQIFEVYVNKEEVMDLDQLARRGIVTRKGFKYLVFKSIKVLRTFREL